jgi:hypothetical protein
MMMFDDSVVTMLCSFFLWSLVAFGGAGVIIRRTGAPVMLVVLLLSTRSWAKTTQGGLMGQIVLDSSDEEAARKFADRVMEEAMVIFGEPSSSWQTMSTTRRRTTNAS